MDREYSADELEAALWRAFVDNHASTIEIASRRETFRIASAAYGVDRGWLTGEIEDRDEQCSVWELRLTDEGRKHFGLA